MDGRGIDGVKAGLGRRFLMLVHAHTEGLALNQAQRCAKPVQLVCGRRLCTVARPTDTRAQADIQSWTARLAIRRRSLRIDKASTVSANP